jgi:hypothetical protein
MVTLLALFFVLDRLDIIYAAGCCSRRSAGRCSRRLVAAAIFVYDLEAHVWRGEGGCTAGSACRLSVEGGVAKLSAREGGAGAGTR